MKRGASGLLHDPRIYIYIYKASYAIWAIKKQYVHNDNSMIDKWEH